MATIPRVSCLRVIENGRSGKPSETKPLSFFINKYKGNKNMPRRDGTGPGGKGPRTGGGRGNCPPKKKK